MNMVDFTQDMAIKSGIDIANYVISYIDQNIIAYDLAKYVRIQEYFVKIYEVNNANNSLCVTLSVNHGSADEVAEHINQYLQQNGKIEVSGKSYDVNCESGTTTDVITLVISPYEYEGLNFAPGIIEQ